MRVCVSGFVCDKKCEKNRLHRNCTTKSAEKLNTSPSLLIVHVGGCQRVGKCHFFGWMRSLGFNAMHTHKRSLDIMLINFHMNTLNEKKFLSPAFSKHVRKWKCLKFRKLSGRNQNHYEQDALVVSKWYMETAFRWCTNFSISLDHSVHFNWKKKFKWVFPQFRTFAIVLCVSILFSIPFIMRWNAPLQRSFVHFMCTVKLCRFQKTVLSQS